MVETSFDYIIIGAGSAGCVLASRLSEKPNISVLLIETGREQKSWRSKIPAGILAMYGRPDFDYCYKSVAQKHLNNREIPMNRGKGLGGSTVINSMIYIRGFAHDYDFWQKNGCQGWAYDDVLPIFKKLEKNLLRQDPKYHGFDGALLVDNPRAANELSTIFVKAGQEKGLPLNQDFNAKDPFGVGIYNVTQDKGQRFSAYHAFIQPHLHRKNLHIWSNSTVEKIIINNKTATKLHIRQNTQNTQNTQNSQNSQNSQNYCEKIISIGKELILTAGAISTPSLLLASGIGPAKELQNNGITVQLDMPGMGKNLQDHIDGMITTRTKNTGSLGLSWQNIPNLLKAPFCYYYARKGMLTTNYVEAGGFAKTAFAKDLPDIQFHFVPGYRSHRGRLVEYGHGYAIHTCLLRPKSRGEIRIRNNTNQIAFDIDPNFFSAEEDAKTLVEAIKVSRSIFAASAFSPYHGEEILPGNHVKTDAEILDYLKAEALTVYHPVGTCKMGIDKMAVVNPASLKIHNMQNIRIADASIMPFLISGNTSAPSMMIGEKAARFILAENT